MVSCVWHMYKCMYILYVQIDVYVCVHMYIVHMYLQCYVFVCMYGIACPSHRLMEWVCVVCYVSLVRLGAERDNPITMVWANFHSLDCQTSTACLTFFLFFVCVCLYVCVGVCVFVVCVMQFPRKRRKFVKFCHGEVFVGQVNLLRPVLHERSWRFGNGRQRWWTVRD